MNREEILEALDELGRDRKWLAESAGYAPIYVKNKLAPNAGELSDKFLASCGRVIDEERRRRKGLGPGSTIWDMVYFSGAEVARIDRGRQAGGYSSLPPMYRDAILSYADELLKGELRVADREAPYQAKDLA